MLDRTPNEPKSLPPWTFAGSDSLLQNFGWHQPADQGCDDFDAAIPHIDPTDENLQANGLETELTLSGFGAALARAVGFTGVSKTLLQRHDWPLDHDNVDKTFVVPSMSLLTNRQVLCFKTHEILFIHKQGSLLFKVLLPLIYWMK